MKSRFCTAVARDSPDLDSAIRTAPPSRLRDTHATISSHALVRRDGCPRLGRTALALSVNPPVDLARPKAAPTRNIALPFAAAGPVPLHTAFSCARLNPSGHDCMLPPFFLTSNNAGCGPLLRKFSAMPCQPRPFGPVTGRGGRRGLRPRVVTLNANGVRHSRVTDGATACCSAPGQKKKEINSRPNRTQCPVAESALAGLREEGTDRTQATETTLLVFLYV